MALGGGLVLVERLRRGALPDIADGGDHDVGVLGAVGQVAAAHAVDADDAQADAVARRRLPRASQRGSRNDGRGGKRRGDGGLEHLAAGDVSISRH